MAAAAAAVTVAVALVPSWEVAPSLRIALEAVIATMAALAAPPFLRRCRRAAGLDGVCVALALGLLAAGGIAAVVLVTAAPGSGSQSKVVDGVWLGAAVLLALAAWTPPPAALAALVPAAALGFLDSRLLHAAAAAAFAAAAVGFTRRPLGAQEPRTWLPVAAVLACFAALNHVIAPSAEPWLVHPAEASACSSTARCCSPPARCSWA